MPIYETGFTEEQEVTAEMTYAVGQQLILIMDYCDAMDWPESIRYDFDLEKAEMLYVSLIMV